MGSRHVLLIAHRVPVDGAFTLNDLAGGGGRMDEVARVVSTAFTVSNGLRRDVVLTILFTALPPPQARRIVVRGERVRYLNPDERSTAALLKNALTRSVRVGEEFEASPGISVGPVEPIEEIRRFVLGPGAIWLTEVGAPLREAENLDGGRFVLGDDLDLNPEEAAVLTSNGVPRVSLGPRSLRASQCIDVLWNELDLREGLAPPSAGRRSV